ncbi:hypothetical protein HKD37_06G016849 [Glycine soja]
MAEKTKKKLEEATQSRSTKGVIDPPSPIRRHVKWKMTCTKKIGQMTFDATKEISEKIDSLEEQASQGSFVPYGRQDLLTAAIWRPEHPSRVRAVGAGVTIKQDFGSAPRTSHSSPSMASEELECSPSCNHRSNHRDLHCLRSLRLVPQLLVLAQRGVVLIPQRLMQTQLVALGRFYEGSTVVHDILLLHGQVKVGVEEVKDAKALVPVPTDEVILVGQALNTFLAWPTHLVKRLSEKAVVSPAKPADRPNHEVMWDATMFRVFNEDFMLYIKHEDLSEIAHGGQCFNISVIQLWILMREGNSDVYEFLEPQPIQRSGQSQFELESYMKSWSRFQNRIAHWQIVVILPKENLVVWFCFLQNRPDNYLKGRINSALKGLDDTPQPKSKASVRWIVVKYFNDVRPLEEKRLKLQLLFHFNIEY